MKTREFTKMIKNVLIKTNDSIKLVRELPEQIRNILLMLEEGPKV